MKTAADDVAVYVRHSRRTQGLPPTVKDRAALERVAAVLVAGNQLASQADEARRAS